MASRGLSAGLVRHLSADARHGFRRLLTAERTVLVAGPAYRAYVAYIENGMPMQLRHDREVGWLQSGVIENRGVSQDVKLPAPYFYTIIDVAL
jgi:hypothetical protein